MASLPKIELALFMVVSWRIARLMRLGRTCSELPASLMFNPGEIRAAYLLTKKPLPSKPPNLNDVVRRVAMHGWFLARKGDGEPGVKRRRKDNKKRLARIGQRYAAVYKADSTA